METLDIVKEAKRKVENYYLMVEGIEKRAEIPSQDREGMYAFLEKHNDIEEVIRIQGAVSNYDYLRAEWRRARDKLKGSAQKLFRVLGNPNFH